MMFLPRPPQLDRNHLLNAPQDQAEPGREDSRDAEAGPGGHFAEVSIEEHAGDDIQGHQ